MKKLLVFMLLGIFLLTISSINVNAQEEACSFGDFTAGQDVEIIQLCATCSYNNVSSIIYPGNSTKIVSNIAMTQSSSEWNYTLPSTAFDPVTGYYTVNGVGDINGVDTSWKCYFYLSKTGTQLELSQTIIYVLLTISIFTFFLLSFYFALMIPYSNNINEKGAVIKVTKLKYFKLTAILVTYGLFVWFLNILLFLSDNFSTISLFYGFISFAFETLIRISLPISLFILVLAFIEIIRDSNIQSHLNKFGTYVR